MDLVQLLKALGDENRVRIINLLKEGELCVGEIEHVLGMTQSNVSRHLIKLSSMKIITSGKKAQWVFYKIDERILKEYPFVEALINAELNKIEQCKIDLKKLSCYKQSGMTCENLKECKCITECNKEGEIS